LVAVLKGLVDFDAVQVGRALRRTRIVAAVVGVAGLVVASLLGQALAGAGIVIGVVLGAMSTQWMDSSVSRLEHVGDAKATRRPIALRTLGRLGVVTVSVVALLVFVTPMGFGALGGLVVYQIAFLSSMISTVFRGPVAQGPAR
jgi:hypothetical protein